MRKRKRDRNIMSRKIGNGSKIDIDGNRELKERKIKGGREKKND